jgi:hypothetical protein
LSNETGLDGVKMGCENAALFFDEPLILASAERTAQLGCPHMPVMDRSYRVISSDLI